METNCHEYGSKTVETHDAFVLVDMLHPPEHISSRVCFHPQAFYDLHDLIGLAPVASSDETDPLAQRKQLVDLSLNIELRWAETQKKLCLTQDGLRACKVSWRKWVRPAAIMYALGHALSISIYMPSNQSNKGCACAWRTAYLQFVSRITSRHTCGTGVQRA